MTAVRPPGLNFLNIWLVPALAAALLGVIVATGDNQALFLGLNALGAHAGAVLWADLTIVGNGSVAMALTLVVLRRRPELAVAVVITAVLTGLAVSGLKDAFHSVRPPGVLAAGSFRLIGPAYSSRSFPSGHTATAFALAGVVSLSFARRWLTLTLAVAAGAVGLSRVMVGVHWPVDVCGGAAVGWLCAAAGVWLAARRRPGPAVQALWAAPLYLAALLLWWPHITAYRDALAFQYVVALVSLAAGAAALPRLLRRDRAGETSDQ